MEPDISILYKIRMDKFQIILYDGNSGKMEDAGNQMIAEFEGLKTDVDIQEVYSRIKFMLTSLNIRSYKRYDKLMDFVIIRICFNI